jgi:hypothetical protein
MMPFDDVVGELLLATGAGVGKRQVEEISVRAAVDFEAFYAQRRAANDVLEETKDLLVLTFDGKGIVMVRRDLRPATQRAARKKARKLATRVTSGEKRNRKRMAEVAAVYTVAPFVRTPFDILADLHGEPDEQADVNDARDVRRSATSGSGPASSTTPRWSSKRRSRRPRRVTPITTARGSCCSTATRTRLRSRRRPRRSWASR